MSPKTILAVILLSAPLVNFAPASQPGQDQEGPAGRLNTGPEAAGYGFRESSTKVGEALNQAQDLRFALDDAGLIVAPAGSTGGAWSLVLRLAAFGREGSLADPDAGSLALHGVRAERSRDHLTEWYVNEARGLEHGFDVPRRWGSAGAAGPLIIEVAMDGPLAAVLVEEDQTVVLRDLRGQDVLRYGGLLVLDAEDAAVPARFRLRSGRIQILVDDAAAAYPLRVDPLLSGPVWSRESNVQGAQTGYALGAAGDVNGDGFGDIIVGSPYFACGTSGEGRAEIFLGSPAGPALFPSWFPEGTNVDAHFGIAVGGAGDVNGDGFADVIVGAEAYTFDQFSEGRAFVYLGSQAGPSFTADWVSEGGHQSFSLYGSSVAAAGDVNGDGYDDVIVGAPRYTNDLPYEGRAYLFLGSATGPSLVPDWTAEGDQAGAEFGTIVASAGDVNGDGFGDVIVSAPNYTNGQAQEGRVYVYLGSASGLPSTPDWLAESNQAGALLGQGAASSAGDVNGDGYGDVIVGAPYFDNGQIDEGRVFVFLGSPSGLAASPAWTAESDQANAEMGRRAGTAGDPDGDGYSDVIVGAWLYDNGQDAEGRAYVYSGSRTGPLSTPAWTYEPDLINANLWSVATAGDVNGDHVDDVLVGAIGYSNGQQREGRALLFRGAGPCIDLDRDGYGSPSSPLCPAGDLLDCNDLDPGVHPGATELCDGVDQDCDGLVDETFTALGLSCSAGVGACSRTGTVVCSASGTSTECDAVPGSPSPELCDGIDNDCDGLRDEDFLLGRLCTVGVGACRRQGVTVCDASGTGSQCGATPGSPSAEICDGIDNDCDSAVDENGIIMAARSISPSTLNVNAQGNAFTLDVELQNTCSPGTPIQVDGHLLGQAFISRAGSAVLPDPYSLPCPDASGSTLFERGIFDHIADRGVNNNAVTLRFNASSDGDCRTLDGDRQDLIGLLADVLDNATTMICVAGSAAGTPVEGCLAATVKNRGNR